MCVCLKNRLMQTKLTSVHEDKRKKKNFHLMHIIFNYLYPWRRLKDSYIYETLK